MDFEKFRNLLTGNHTEPEDSSDEEETSVEEELGTDRQEHVTNNLVTLPSASREVERNTNPAVLDTHSPITRDESSKEISRLTEELENIQLQRSRLLQLTWLDMKEEKIRAILNGLH
jgi:hypothetical protein